MKKINGFSLMEMMVVLLILSIIAAATAPMVNKKMVDSNKKSPWVVAHGGIAYNLKGLKQSALIGSSTFPKDGSRLFIQTKKNE